MVNQVAHRDGPLYWSTDRVMAELGVSRPTLTS